MIEGLIMPPGLLLETLASSMEEDANGFIQPQDFISPGIPSNFNTIPSRPTNFSELVAERNLDAFITFGTPRLDNFTNYDYEIEYPDFSQNEIVRGIFICLFISESIIGVLGNFFVCLTVYKNKSMHSSVNYYIVNLGICDFLVGAVVLPVKLFELTADSEMNMMNDFWCTTVRFVETIVVFASVFTLVAICFERYNAVVYPVQSRINMTNMRIKRVLTVVWLIPGLVAAPNLYPAVSISHFLFSEFGEFSRVTCFDRFTDSFRFWYFMVLFIFMYIIPLCFIVVTCFSIARVLLKEIPVQPRRDPRALSLEQGRRKVAKMVLVVVLSFLVFWSPYFIVTAVTQLQTENFLHKGQYFFTMLFINLLAFTNSCVNPFVYFAMSARFRKGFLSIVRSLRCSRRNRYSPENSQSSLRASNNRTLNGVLSLQAQPSRRLMGSIYNNRMENSLRGTRNENRLRSSSPRTRGRDSSPVPPITHNNSSSGSLSVPKPRWT